LIDRIITNLDLVYYPFHRALVLREEYSSLGTNGWRSRELEPTLWNEIRRRRGTTGSLHQETRC